ncbi:hypothetical protein [Enterococcus mundtii]|uniref:hypothetical protein n=1 Tax=Enterococcus mundtii TaxID=53346 RepID=UPI001A96DF20|nr:hypothetical protein [Enterococcus mundtii]MBO1087149.1 hypothetical protein [Enterococcus mundtii]
MAKINISIDTDNMTLAELLLLSEQVVGEYVRRSKELSNNLSIIDKELSSISHRMETSAENVVGGYKLYERFRELRRVRRVIKNDSNFNRAMNDEGLKMETMSDYLTKGSRNYKAKKNYLDKQRDYLNVDRLGAIDWKIVEETVNSCLPKVDQQKDVLKNKMMAINAQ